MAVINTQQLDCMGHPIYIFQVGPDAGPLVLLLHGKMFQEATWQENGTLAKLVYNGYRAVALGMLSFNNSPAANIEPAEVLKTAIKLPRIE